MKSTTLYATFHLGKQAIALAFVLLLLGCVNSSQRSTFSLAHTPLAEQNPIQHFDQEVMVARLGQMLNLTPKLSKRERADMHFERGVLYDSLGLWALARYDFAQALVLVPKMPAVYNYLGLYLLLDGDFDSAVDAFNSVLHLDPSYDYAYLNRGLTFYYAGRYALAQRDFLAFYNADPSDPYRTLWLYLNELKYNPNNATANLAVRAPKLSDAFWGTHIVHYYLGTISYEQLLTNMAKFAQPYSPQYAEMLTETYFYLAKQQLNLGKVPQARALFKLAIANQVFNFVEYRFALFELSRLNDEANSNKNVVTDIH
ncbi:lipoprotein NlpI [Pasteurellaceae bacterium HPA106]|uniref:lipoprotein NlpI n=1 Tax=Spirabiliibacterium pneumoniae TaxID=221400 RepID=UPI001AAC756B|nr:lipoprotein NlpI [Spirabiliibacterium pneumoniae]MBE2895819.1 lipoprotein NlpI [Spirabiliibacterium pneumoniae]